MAKKSFILHDADDGSEILIAASTFMYACTNTEGDTFICTEEREWEVKESLHEIQKLYEETEE